MRLLVLVPWKPVVLIWAVLIAMILVGFTASSILQGTSHPGVPRSAVTRSAHSKPVQRNAQSSPAKR